MKNIKISEEKMDFLREIINIGSGHAAGALEQLLGVRINVDMPEVEIVTREMLSAVIGSPDKPVVGVEMNIIGDVKGTLFFVVSEENKAALTNIAEMAKPGGGGRKKVETDESVIEEIGNIMTGVYLTSVHDFTGLDVYHTVPCTSRDMLLSLIDESIADNTRMSLNFVTIKNSFRVESSENINMQVFFIIIYRIDSVMVFMNSLERARKKMFDE